MSPNTRNVVADEGARPVHIIDEKGEAVLVGNLTSTIYQGEKVQRHTYQRIGDKRVYSLGATSNQFKFVDHPAALAPFIGNGWKVVKQVVTRGGLQMWTQLEPENPVTIQDLIRWDLNQWADSTRVTDHALRESIIAISAVRPKKAIMYRRGWFRQVCSNGMVAEILGLGTLRMNHNQWSSDKLNTWVNKTTLKPSQREAKAVLGPVMGNKRGADRLANVIETRLLPGKDDHRELSDEEIEERMADVPLFVRNAISPLARQAGWYLRDSAFQLREYVDKAEYDRFHALDLVNVVTNPINRAPAGKNSNRALMATPSLVKSLTSLVGAMSL